MPKKTLRNGFANLILCWNMARRVFPKDIKINVEKTR